MSASDKTSLLINLIDNLCLKEFVSSTLKADAIKTLQEVYDGTFRHSYSDIFNKLQQVLKQDFEVGETLGENLNVLKNELVSTIDISTDKEAPLSSSELQADEISEVKQEDNESKSVDHPIIEPNKTPVSQAVVNGFVKFCDYIQLEIARNNLFQSQFKELTFSKKFTSQDEHPIDEQQNNEIISKINEISGKLKDAQRTLDEFPSLREDTKRDIDKFDEKLETSKVSSITALSIFSAVILAFSGGITFEAGVFKGISDVSAFRLVFIVALTGFILFNTVFALLYLVSRIAGKSVESTCKYSCKECSKDSQYQKCGNDYCEKPLSEVTLLCRIKHKFSYVLIINLVFIIVMFEDFVLWSLQNQSWTWTKVFVLSIPVLLVLAFGLILLIEKLIQKHRAYIMQRNQLVLSVYQDNKLFSGFTKIIKTLAQTFLQNNQDDFVKEASSISEIIDTEKANEKPCYCRLQRKIRIFVKESSEQHPEYLRRISFAVHRKNMRIWRKIKSFLKNSFKHKK